MQNGPEPRNPWTPLVMAITLLALLGLGAFGGCTVGFIGAMGLGQFETWPLTVGICAGVVLALVGWWLIWRKRH